MSKKPSYRIEYSPDTEDHLALLTAHYDVEEVPARIVIVKAVALKNRDRVLIGGREIKL